LPASASDPAGAGEPLDARSLEPRRGQPPQHGRIPHGGAQARARRAPTPAWAGGSAALESRQPRQWARPRYGPGLARPVGAGVVQPRQPRPRRSPTWAAPAGQRASGQAPTVGQLHRRLAKTAQRGRPRRGRGPGGRVRLPQRGRLRPRRRLDEQGGWNASVPAGGCRAVAPWPPWRRRLPAGAVRVRKSLTAPICFGRVDFLVGRPAWLGRRAGHQAAAWPA
jgi:hypothetical protein